MQKIAAFIVDRRNLFFLIYLFAIIFCVIARDWVTVEDDITAYLPQDTETRQGLTVMEDNFTTYGAARVMVSNITYAQAQELQEQIEAVEGVTSAELDDSEEHYKNAAALFSVSFDQPAHDPAAIRSMEQVRQLLDGYDAAYDTEVGVDFATKLAQEMVVIILIAAAIIVAALVLTSRAYMEVPVLLITFVTAAILNMGTNFLCGTISFVSNSVTVVLQLALAIDYAIILCHRFSDEHETLGARDACVAALSKAIPEISSSSLTTISGLAALAFMHFGIGRDLAMVLIKAIFFSLLSVFTLMPGLLMVFSPLIDRTRHKKLLPNISWVGHLDARLKYIMPPVFLVVALIASWFSGKCPYCYSSTELTTIKPSQTQADYQKIKSVFGTDNMVALVLPAGDYKAEKAILHELDDMPQVKSTLGLANIEAKDGYCLADEVTPRQLSELGGVDYEVAKMLFSAYALDQNEYGQIINGLENYKVPLFDIFTFLETQMHDGKITLPGEAQETLDDLFSQLDEARVQLQSPDYSRLVLYLNVPEESPETFAFLDTLHEIMGRYYDGGYYVVGNSTSDFDLSSSFSQDNILISILSALFVIVILLFTFNSAGLPVLLILVIQGSIWVNFSFPYLRSEPLFFLSYLIVNAIQMGANIDYAIVISSHYTALKAYHKPAEAMTEALNESFPTIITSGAILASAGTLIGCMTTEPIISTIGMCLGRGTVISMLLVLFVLPEILLLGDTIIEKTRFALPGIVRTKAVSGTVRIRGHVRGYVAGIIDADIDGVLKGDFNASLSTGTSVEGGTPPPRALEGHARETEPEPQKPLPAGSPEEEKGGEDQ